MSRIRGSWPGGPGRRGPGDAGAAPRRRLESAEEIDAQLGRSAGARLRRRHRRRVWWLLASAMVVAGGSGLYLGFRAHRSSERLTAEHEAERRSSATFDLTRETNRMLLELWRMEDVERQDRMVVP